MKNKVFVTTSWDDGHRLDIKLTQLLKKYSLPGTIYYAPENREWLDGDLLRVEQVKELSHEFEIGGHTVTHPSLTRVSLDVAKKEIYDSRTYLQDILDKEIKSFCYPKGHYNSEIKRIVKEAGYENARTVERFNFVIDDQYAIATSLHAYQHYQDILKILKFSNHNLRSAWKNWDWEHLAKAEFDYVLENGGVFHLWGHSWEIEKNADWERLERVFDYISNHTNVYYGDFSTIVHRSLTI
ncbi:polysaccharide deacetylase family protein [candidate division WWE3 bacterium]|uniref:Polysaccharide deacetylase family protein n=1 Tax=candidate division WWE3 bacterium TaxID=2053526 RepID=A0A955LV91_UNCKA|nr:polysaccharide deacetylase family protein [candidate division WWE3 bacterium]